MAIPCSNTLASFMTSRVRAAERGGKGGKLPKVNHFRRMNLKGMVSGATSFGFAQGSPKTLSGPVNSGHVGLTGQKFCFLEIAANI